MQFRQIQIVSMLVLSTQVTASVPIAEPKLGDDWENIKTLPAAEPVSTGTAQKAEAEYEQHIPYPVWKESADMLPTSITLRHGNPAQKQEWDTTTFDQGVLAAEILPFMLGEFELSVQWSAAAGTLKLFPEVGSTEYGPPIQYPKYFAWCSQEKGLELLSSNKLEKVGLKAYQTRINPNPQRGGFEFYLSLDEDQEVPSRKQPDSNEEVTGTFLGLSWFAGWTHAQMRKVYTAIHDFTESPPVRLTGHPLADFLAVVNEAVAFLSTDRDSQDVDAREHHVEALKDGIGALVGAIGKLEEDPIAEVTTEAKGVGDGVVQLLELLDKAENASATLTSKLTAAESELTETKGQLSDTKSELTETKGQLTATESELVTTEKWKTFYMGALGVAGITAGFLGIWAYNRWRSAPVQQPVVFVIGPVRKVMVPSAK
ncbi:MAG: DUF1515 domain-containing protein [Holosporales bacterium]|jgi:hypothetical protein|nr:DUF1515 domain-containing protein [Holosporales bacterium]